MEAPLTAGTLLVDRYRLIDQIGAGGMSVIWRAHDEVLERIVALKVLSGELAADQRFRDLVREEARNAAQLVHRHVTAVHDYGETVGTDGTVTAFVVMELVDGEPLERRLTAGPLPWPEAVQVCAQVAEALAAAHRLGIVHRDITPGNIMLTKAGVKVLDFGIATRIGMPDLDDSGDTFGTPAYVAPERLDGAPTLPATDTYALGVLIYETLTGHVPYPALTWDDLARTPRHHTPPAPVGVPGLPAAVAELCRSCLADSPLNRPTAHQVAERLRACLPVGDSAGGRVTGQDADLSGCRTDDATSVRAPVRAAASPVHAAAGQSARRQRARRWGRVAAVLATTVAVVASTAVLVATLHEPNGGHARQAPVPTTPDPVSPEPDGQRPQTPRQTNPVIPADAEPADSPTVKSGGTDAGVEISATFDEINRILDAGVSAEEIRPDTAGDLRNVMDNLRYALDQGTTSLAEEVPRLRDKVDARRREGAISDASAQLLDDQLVRLASL